MKRFILFIGTFLIMCMSVMFSGCSEIDNVKTDLIVDIVSVNEDVSVCAIPEFIDSEKTYNIECQKIIGNMAITRALAIPGNILIPYATMTQLPVELELCISEKRIRYYLGGVTVFDGQAEEVFLERLVETILKILKK